MVIEEEDEEEEIEYVEMEEEGKERDLQESANK